MEIQINIVDKHAIVIGAPVIVCGNSDYSVKFNLDAEWDGATTKTARFVYVQDGEVKYQDVVFVGDTVAVPILANTKEVRVGLYAGDLHTTAPAHIPCELSIRCGTAAPDEPTPSQYDQIMALLQAGELKGPKGDPGDQGPRGDAFTYEDFTPEQLAALKGEKGEKGDPFTFMDFTAEQLATLKGADGKDGAKGDTGDPFTYEDFTPEQLAALKGEKGESGQIIGGYWFEIDENGDLYAYAENEGDIPEFEYDDESGELYMILEE